MWETSRSLSPRHLLLSLFWQWMQVFCVWVYVCFWRERSTTVTGSSTVTKKFHLIPLMNNNHSKWWDKSVPEIAARATRTWPCFQALTWTKPTTRTWSWCFAITPSLSSLCCSVCSAPPSSPVPSGSFEKKRMEARERSVKAELGAIIMD